MATLPQDLQTSSRAIPEALSELQKSSQSIQQVTDYCRQLGQSGTSMDETLRQTKDYVKASLGHVFYHVHAVGLQITNFLQLQANELEKIDVTVRLISEKMKAAKDMVGAVGLHSMTENRIYRTKTKARKLEGVETNERYQRVQLNLKALENIGVVIADPSIARSESSSLLTSSVSAPSKLTTPLSSPSSPPPLSVPSSGTLRGLQSQSSSNLQTLSTPPGYAPSPPALSNSNDLLPPPFQLPPPPRFM